MAGGDQRLQAVLASSTKEFDSDTVASACDLLTFADGLGLPPDEILEGYWPTFQVFWKSLEIEVFGDHIEVYPDGDPFRVWYEDHQPGDAFSERLKTAVQQGARPPAPR